MTEYQNSGLGIAMVEIDRIERVYLHRPGSLQRCFQPEELERSLRRSRPAEDLAGRYACKLAVRKALGGRLPASSSLLAIVTGNDSLGKPVIHFKAPLDELEACVQVQVSITHTRQHAAAIAVVSPA